MIKNSSNHVGEVINLTIFTRSVVCINASYVDGSAYLNAIRYITAAATINDMNVINASTIILKYSFTELWNVTYPILYDLYDILFPVE